MVKEVFFYIDNLSIRFFVLLKISISGQTRYFKNEQTCLFSKLSIYLHNEAFGNQTNYR